MSHYSGPLLTRPLAEALLAARDTGAPVWNGSLDLGLSRSDALLAPESWQWRDGRYPYPSALKDRTVYYWDGDEFAPVARFSGSLIKLSQVVLELTERDPIENFTATRQVIAALQGLGVRIAIDDVGTGHSGLSYMLKLGVDIIKIDKMFVDAIGTDRNSTTIVETLVDLAHNMRMDVVAEGVENFEQVMHLRELGIRSAQGYVFAPPLPGSAFLQLIEAIDPLPVAAVEQKLASARNRFNAA